MSDRERSGQRPDISAVQSAGAGASQSSFISGFLPNLFGRRTSGKTPSGHDVRKASPSSGITRESIDESRMLASPPTGSVALPSLTTATAGSSSTAAPSAPFHLQAALALLEPGSTKTTAETAEIVKATSVHLANLLLDHSAGTSLLTLAELGLRPSDIRTLYARAMECSELGTDYQLRTAAIRLLAVLIGLVPPRQSILDANVADLPVTITPRALYRLITTPSGAKPGEARINQMFVEVSALKALTHGGEQVDGMDGIVGYLLQALKDLGTEWLAWCADRDEEVPALGAPPADTAAETRSTPFGPIKSATPAATATEIIDLTALIIQHRTPLFTPADLTHIVQPMISFVWSGILASTSPPQPSMTPATPSASISRRSQHASPSSPTNTPAPRRTGASLTSSSSIRRTASLTVGRVEAFPSSIRSSKSPVRQAATRSAKWSLPFTSLCALVHMLFEATTINDDLFDEVFELLCFAFGQDERDALMNTAETSIGAHELVRTMLGSKSGRRGELSLRRALEDKLLVTNMDRKSTGVERKITRGAVIIARMCIEDREFVSHSGSSSLSFTGLTPSLASALSTSRFPGTARVTEWAQWLPVDAEIMTLLDNHLASLEYGDGAESSTDDAWTEGEAACELLDGIHPLIQTMA